MSRLKVVSKFLVGRACNHPLLLLGTYTTNKAENAIFMHWDDCKINNDRGLLFLERGANANRGNSYYVHLLCLWVSTLFSLSNKWKNVVHLLCYFLFL